MIFFTYWYPKKFADIVAQLFHYQKQKLFLESIYRHEFMSLLTLFVQVMTSNYRYTRASVSNPRAQRAFAREVIALVPLAARIRRSVADRQTARAAAVLMRRPEFIDLMSNVLERMHLGIFQEPIIEPVPVLSEDELNAFRILVRGPEDNPYEPIRVAPGAPLRPPADPHTPPRGGRRLVFESPQQGV